MAWSLLHHSHNDEENAEAVEHIMRLAEWDHAAAQFELAQLYEQGRIVPQDVKQAAHWFQEAAFNYHAEAAMRIGLMYLNGEGVEKNIQQAMHGGILPPTEG